MARSARSTTVRATRGAGSRPRLGCERAEKTRRYPSVGESERGARGSPLVDFKNRDDVERWLKGEAREVAIVIAARSALRAVPALVTAVARDGVRGAGPVFILPTFRGMAAPWATVGYPAHGAALRAAAASPAGYADYAAADADYGAALASPAAAAGYAMSAAASAAFAAVAAADYAAADAGRAVAASDYAAADAGRAVAAAAAGDADEIDAGLRAGGHASAVAAALALRPLWPDGEPEWASEAGKSSKRPCLPPAKTGRYGLTGTRRGCAAGLRTKRSKSPA